MSSLQPFTLGSSLLKLGFVPLSWSSMHCTTLSSQDYCWFTLFGGPCLLPNAAAAECTINLVKGINFSRLGPLENASVISSLYMSLPFFPTKVLHAVCTL